MSFTKNRLCNRPHRPRDPILRDYLAAIGVTWPAKPSGESEDESQSESTSEDAAEASESEDGEDDECDECEDVGKEGTWGSIEIFWNSIRLGHVWIGGFV